MWWFIRAHTIGGFENMQSGASEEPQFAAWLAALEARHLADLRVPEVTRALRALSSAYVERRHRVAYGTALDSTGKRAAFALFYAPLHFITMQHVLCALGARVSPLSSILDIGCGTGAAGAAWALAVHNSPKVYGIDRHPWAVEETRWTYRHFRLRGQARQGDVVRLPSLRAGSAAVAAYILNELSDISRRRVEDALLAAAGRGARVLVLEPIARAVVPWWDASAKRIEGAGGRADEWRFLADLPPLLRLLDKAAGLNHGELKVRSLYCSGAAG
jgi:SAM-dependent methyltransferase